ncbi:MAG TPA: phosphate signaling complex protein PhoU [Jiangellaceae bacterium]|nr:phosphate signaling complex protein PhoU [Jiangellaceae bacterium]
MVPIADEVPTSHCGSLFTETYLRVHLGESARHIRVSSLWKPSLNCSLHPERGDQRMRQAFQEQLEDVNHRLVEMSRQAGEQIRAATTALLDADIQLADRTVAADVELNRAQLDIEERILELMARQAPVAGDLRTVLAAQRSGLDIERMGDLAVHVAKIARMRYPEVAVPEEFRTTFKDMGHTAEAMAAKAGAVLRLRDLDAAAELASDDNEMDRLHRTLFVVMFDDDWDRGVGVAVDVALLGRYYERFADHAVNVAANVRYLVTGEVEWISGGPAR